MKKRQIVKRKLPRKVVHPIVSNNVRYLQHLPTYILHLYWQFDCHCQIILFTYFDSWKYLLVELLIEKCYQSWFGFIHRFPKSQKHFTKHFSSLFPLLPASVFIYSLHNECIYTLGLIKDSYRYRQNTPTLMFENLKPVEKSRNHLNVIWTSSIESK